MTDTENKSAPAPTTETETEEARAYFAREAMKVARHDVARTLFEHVITNIAHIAATLPAGALVRDFAAGLPTGEDARDGWWIAAFTTAVRALERPHYNASLERWQRARDLFNLGNATEREQGAAELYAWWNDDAPAMCRTVVASPVANNAVLAMLGLEPESPTEQPQPKADRWPFDPSADAPKIVAAFNLLTNKLNAAETGMNELRYTLQQTSNELEETRKSLNGMQLQRDFAQDELEETRKASALELSVMREERDTARAERDELRKRLEALSVDDST